MKAQESTRVRCPFCGKHGDGMMVVDVDKDRPHPRVTIHLPDDWIWTGSYPQICCRECSVAWSNGRAEPIDRKDTRAAIVTYLRKRSEDVVPHTVSLVLGSIADSIESGEWVRQPSYYGVPVGELEAEAAEAEESELKP